MTVISIAGATAITGDSMDGMEEVRIIASIATAITVAPKRSEERRVGKECRSRCDWSSDVCSSDLYKHSRRDGDYRRFDGRHGRSKDHRFNRHGNYRRAEKIGRASCRERV